MKHRIRIAACSAALSMFAAAVHATTVAITVPDGNFSSDTPAGYINNYSHAGGLTFTAPMTGTLSGWALSAAPSTENGGYYNSGGWDPYGVVDNVTSGGSSPQNDNAAYIGSQPSSTYHDFEYYPGEQFGQQYGQLLGPGNVPITTPTPQTGASLTMTTTGISANAATGYTYTATIQYANVSWNTVHNTSATVQLEIMAGSNIIGTGTLAGLAQNSPWTTITATTAAVPSADAGLPIELKVLASNFLEGASQWNVPTFALTNATLTSTTPATTPLISLVSHSGTLTTTSGTKLTHTQTAAGASGFSPDPGTGNDYIQILGSATGGYQPGQAAVKSGAGDGSTNGTGGSGAIANGNTEVVFGNGSTLGTSAVEIYALDVNITGGPAGADMGNLVADLNGANGFNQTGEASLARPTGLPGGFATGTFNGVTWNSSNVANTATAGVIYITTTSTSQDNLLGWNLGGGTGSGLALDDSTNFSGAVVNVAAVAAIPEPATAVATIISAAACLLARRRRAQA